jgi:serine/threonine-protein kinase
VAGDPDDDTDPAIDLRTASGAAARSGEPDLASADTHASAGGAESSRSTSRGPRAVRSGDTLGRYELGDELGEGGMATVFRARDKELRRDVALKVLFPHLARRDEVVRRFQREARAAAGLEHANILRIYDVGGALGSGQEAGPDGSMTRGGDDPPYIVREMIRGRSLLAEVEQRGPMFAEIAACIGALLADALAAAHKASIVHRDMKPANVMIAPGGRILLTDFGVARLETEDSLVTKTGAVLGTPAYMSPEQASGDTATAKSDLYSLGATLYQLATGTLPYGGSPAKVLAQIASGAATPAVKKRPSVGPDLSRAIEKLMAVDPDQRTASATVAAAELRAIAASGGLGEPADELAVYFADPDAYIKARTPKIVATTVAAAKQALADGKLPRAMALADRAGSLAPGDASVAALIEQVAAGGRATHRKRLAAIVLGAAVVAGGGGFAAYELLGSHGEAPSIDAAVPIDAPLLDAAIDAAIDAPPDASEPDAALPDAGPGKPKKDGGMVAAAVPLDAMEIDAAVAMAIDAMPAAPGKIIVKADSWCDVTVDGEPKGQKALGKTLTITVAAGTHTVVCAQTGLPNTWTQAVEVPAGGSVIAEGNLVPTFDVVLDIDVKIDGTEHKAGSTVKLKARHQFEAGGVRKSITINGPCRLRESPQLDCYP